MAHLPCFASAELEAACKVLGETTNGLSGNEIGHLLLTIGVDDPDRNATVDADRKLTHLQGVC